MTWLSVSSAKLNIEAFGFATRFNIGTEIGLFLIGGQV